MTNSTQSARSENVKAIVDFFKSGIKTDASSLGIELEHTLVKKDGSPVSYSGEHGVAWLLNELKNDSYTAASYDQDGDILGVAKPGQAVTIEPASQVELSAGPFTDLMEARNCFDEFEDRLSHLLDPKGIEALTVGYHPTARAKDLELIPKQRYKLMNAYLGSVSPFGICMMRGSASTQISIDYTSAEDCLRKLRLAFSLTPLFSLICDNSPVFEGAPRTHELTRTEIWKYCDPDRCGVIPGIMSPSFALEDYASYILDTPAILINTADGLTEGETRTFGEIYADKIMTKSEVEHACSMFFTDVRLKTYVEIRPADAMPIPYVIAYAALIKGLFYSETSLSELESIFAGVNENDIAQAKEALMENGYGATVYGRPVAELADRIIEISTRALDDDAELLAPLSDLVSSRTTLARIAEIGR